MERLSSTNNLMVMSPVVVGKDEADKIGVMIYGTGGSMTGLTLYAISPRGQITDVTAYLSEITTGLTFLTLFEATFTFGSSGRYKFILHDTVSGDVIVSSTDVPEWTSNIDMKVSEVAKQRVDIQRIYGRIKQGG